VNALVSDSLVFARRNAAHVRQIPEKLIDVTLQPLMFVLLFSFVFGNVIAIPGGGDYKEYLLAGILVQTLAFGMMGPGVAIATDLTEGIIDRFRSLPTSRAAYLIGHILSEMATAMIGLVVLVISGLIVGWGIHDGVWNAAAGFGLLILFSMTMIWAGTLLGLTARSADSVQGVMFLVMFPLTFLSNAFVPADGLPSGLRAVSNWNPISALVAAARDLFGNPTAVPHDAPWSLEHPVVTSLLWCVGLLTLVVPLTLARYRRRTTG
jgi:ABC transporter DrrB family efflux protein